MRTTPTKFFDLIEREFAHLDHKHLTTHIFELVVDFSTPTQGRASIQWPKLFGELGRFYFDFDGPINISTRPDDPVAAIIPPNSTDGANNRMLSGPIEVQLFLGDLFTLLDEWAEDGLGA